MAFEKHLLKKFQLGIFLKNKKISISAINLQSISLKNSLQYLCGKEQNNSGMNVLCDVDVCTARYVFAASISKNNIDFKEILKIQLFSKTITTYNIFQPANMMVLTMRMPFKISAMKLQNDLAIVIIEITSTIMLVKYLQI